MSRAKARRAALRRAQRVNAATSTTSNPREWFIDWVSGGSKTDAGVKINGTTALNVSSVWQAVTVLAGDVAQLPLDVYARKEDDTREVDRKHQSYRLMKRRSHPRISAFTFRETLMSHALLYGNGVAEIVRDADRKPLFLTEDGTDVRYITRVAGEEYVLKPGNVFHVVGLSQEGLWGLSVWQHAKNSFGLAAAQEKHANVSFGNGSKPSGVLEHPGKMKPEAADALRKRWDKLHQGLDNAARVAVLEQGMTYKPFSFSNVDAQMIESRQFQRSEIASWFNLPPHKVGDHTHSTFSNVAELNRNYLNQSLMRWLVKWQDECNEKLLTEPQKMRDTHYFEFNTSALLRGTTKERYEAYRIASAGQPFMTINEIRRRENMNPVDGFDEISQPLNMGNPGGDAEYTEDAEDPDATRDAIGNRIRHLIGVEQNRIRQAAAKAKNFTEWVQTFYGGWQDRLAKAVVDLGGDEHHAQEWCQESARQVVGLLDHSTQASLAGDVEGVFATWGPRVEYLIDQLRELN